jgi:hypothetical protein
MNLREANFAYLYVFQHVSTSFNYPGVRIGYGQASAAVLLAVVTCIKLSSTNMVKKTNSPIHALSVIYTILEN